nr:titin-like [Misgurnus anguillicaudatus]
MWYKGRTGTSVFEGNSYTIRSPSDQDEFWCRGKRDGRPSSSQDSNHVTLSVKALPRATVRVTADGPLFTGDTVTLKCEIENQHRSLNWRYRWYKGTTKVSRLQHYTITGVTESDQEEISCSADIHGRTQTLLSSSSVYLNVKALPRVRVRVTPDRPVFTGETVTLKCEIEDQYRSLNWRYLWYKSRTVVLNSGRYTVNRDSLTIRGVTESDQDEFSCSAEIHGRLKTSNFAVHLTVNALPRATVRVTPDRSVFTGEKVTLKCEIEDQYSDWRYKWYKGRTETSVSEGNIYTIRSPSDQDEFWCRGERVGRPSSSQYSDHVTLSVKAIPRATVRVTPKSPVIIGETVTLKCEIEGQYSNWTYKWYKDTTGTSVFEGNIYTIISPSDQDKFRCRGERDGRPSSSQYSDHVTLSVKAIPRATVRVTPKSPVIIGETVTLKCEIEDQYSNWRYLWSKNTTEVLNFENYTVNRDSLTITGVTQSDQDEFRCRAEIHGRPKTSLSSSSVHLTVKERPTPQVFVWPDDHVFRGETANLRCVINRGVVSSWQYSWNKDSSLYHISDLQNYTIRSVTESDAGKYTCKGNETNGSQYSDISDAVTLTVSALPKITVRVTPDRSVFTGETVTLTCEIEDQYRSLNWRYLWYKGTAEVLNYKHYTVNRDSLTINGVTGSDQDEFSCSADIHGRPQTSLSSSAVYLNVYALPRATVNVTSDRSVFTGETVTLKCEIEDKYSDWRYMWYKGRPGTSVFEGNIYTISSPSDQDEFRCRGERDGRPSSSQYSDHVTLSVKALPRATVRVIPDRSVFTGETVTLTCEIEDQYSNWTYQWFKDTTGTSVFEGNIYTIISPSDQDKFRCRGERDGRPSSSQYSDHVTLSVKAIPRATVRVTPKSPVIIGETVTLKCEIEDQYSNWTYKWYKDTTGTSVFEGNIYTIISPSDQDKFRCRGERDGRPSSSQYSNHVTLSVKALPRATVSVTPYSPVIIGETVTLKCEIEDRYRSLNWRYLWYKNTTSVLNFENYTVKGDSITIIGVTESDQDKFRCSAVIHGRPKTSLSSSAVHLTVKERPTPQVSVWPGEDVYRGTTVNLTCVINIGGVSSWQYSWYKDSIIQQNKLQRYTIRYVTESDTGNYSCRGHDINGLRYSHISDAVTLTVSENLKPVVSVDPDKQLFRGETVTLRCDIQDTEDTEWTYSWTNNRNIITQCKTQGCKINNIQHTDGRYKITCTGEIRGQKTEMSDAVTLTVSSDKPKTVLSVSPQHWLTEGDSVTLMCEVRSSSTGWTFSWFTLKSSYSGYELMSDSSGGSKGIYTVSSVTVKHTGVYMCRAERGDPVYHTEYSNTQTLWITEVSGVSPSVSLIIRPNRSQHFSSESLSLSCEDHSNSTGWTVRRYTDKLESCPSSDTRSTGTTSTCTIRYLDTSDTGVYWCQSESGEKLHPVNISVHYGNAILDSPVHPVTVGDNLSLRCLYRNKNPSTQRAEFYKDGSVVQTTGDMMIIPTVSKSHEGFYYCKQPWRIESPKSWISVRDKPTLTVQPQTSVFIGDTVTLTCEMSQSTGWEFILITPSNTKSTETTGTKTIYLQVSDGGEYKCRARRENPQVYTQDSEPVTVTVQERPIPEVSVWPDDHVYRGETVNLMCVINGGGVSSWQYSWYKDSSLYNISDLQNYTIRSVTESDTGNYTCRGNETRGSRYSHISDSVALTVSGESIYLFSSSSTIYCLI